MQSRESYLQPLGLSKLSKLWKADLGEPPVVGIFILWLYSTCWCWKQNFFAQIPDLTARIDLLDLGSDPEARKSESIECIISSLITLYLRISSFDVFWKGQCTPTTLKLLHIHKNSLSRQNIARNPLINTEQREDCLRDGWSRGDIERAPPIPVVTLNFPFQEWARDISKWLSQSQETS